MYYNRNRHVGLSIRHDRQETHEFTRFSMHTHTTAELFYFVAGKAVYHIEGNSYTLQPGDILLMRPSEAHYVEQDPNVPYERICLNFETTLLSPLDPENTLLRPYYDREAGKRNLYRTADMKDGQCRTYLDNILKAEDRLNAIANLIRNKDKDSTEAYSQEKKDRQVHQQRAHWSAADERNIHSQRRDERRRTWF